MKNIEISQSNLTITDLLDLAEQDAIILKKSDGTEFILSVIDDFTEEVKALANNQEFMDFLLQRSQVIPKLSLEEARKRLNID